MERTYADIELHDDGTITYWSVVHRQWRRERPSWIPVQDLAAMRDEERERIREYAAQHGERI